MTQHGFLDIWVLWCVMFYFLRGVYYGVSVMTDMARLVYLSILCAYHGLDTWKKFSVWMLNLVLKKLRVYEP